MYGAYVWIELLQLGRVEFVVGTVSGKYAQLFLLRKVFPRERVVDDITVHFQNFIVGYDAWVRHVERPRDVL